MKSIISTLAVLLVALFLTACGQSGPLFVPGDPSTIQAPVSPDAEKAQKEEDEDEDSDSQ